MKKIILFLVLSALAFTSFSQVEEHNGKKYILPDAISSKGCIPCSVADSLNIPYDALWSWFFWFYGDHNNNNYFYKTSDQAQLFHAIDSVKVIGVAGYMRTTQDAFVMNNYIGIADTSFNILEEKVLTDLLTNNNLLYPYFELIFDNPVQVIGDFYVRTDFAKPNKYNKDGVLYEDTLNYKYNWDSTNTNIPYYANAQIQIPLIRSEERCHRQTIMAHPIDYYVGSNYDNTIDYGWKSFYDTTGMGYLAEYTYEYVSKIYGAYLFPLIGEDEDDTVSSVPSVEVENYTYVFPNPASENVTVQCSFKIKSIEMFNEQGQKVMETESNAYNTTIDVSKYPKGTYILKVSTQSGTATKKIVVQ